MDTTPEVTPEDQARVLVIREHNDNGALGWEVLGTTPVIDTGYSALLQAVERMAPGVGRYYAVRTDRHGAQAFEVKLTVSYAD